jgi:hypothetical protein
MVRSPELFVLNLYLCLAGCSYNDTTSHSPLRFTGRWTETFEVSRAEITRKVVADGERYRIDKAGSTAAGALVATTDTTEANIWLFDGHRFFVRNKELLGDKGHVVVPTPKEMVISNRFWIEEAPKRTGAFGGLVAGRETLFYEVKEPVSGSTFKRWFDKDTGILLKEEYWKGENPTPVSVLECQHISYGEIDPSAFRIPEDVSQTH